MLEMRGRCHGREKIRYGGWALGRSELTCLVEVEDLMFLVRGEHSAKELSCGG